MAKYKAYPEYKDSGVEWVTSIPSHWNVKPTFSCCDASTVKNTDGLEYNVLSLSYGKIVSRDIDSNYGLLPESFNTYQLVNKGDTILRLTDLQNDKKSLRVGLVTQQGIITSAYLKLSPRNNLTSYYLYQILHSYDTMKVFYGMGNGLRQSMKFEEFRRLPILTPKINEQNTIIKFIKYQTTKIDRLIKKQQQLIKLLKEKRQALISHAVTKGLNPDVPMKDSGVEWLGLIPANWNIKKLGFIGTASNGLTYSPDEITFDSSGTLVLRSSNIQHSKLCLDDTVFVNKKIPSKFKLLENDILICSRNGSRKLIGKNILIGKNSEEMSYGAFMAVFRSEINKFIYWILNSSIFEYQSSSFLTSTINQLTIDNLSSMVVAIPPLDEQKKITQRLFDHDVRYSKILNKIKYSIELLKERRTALIAAAVTGKIDLRDWTPPASSPEQSPIAEEAIA